MRLGDGTGRRPGPRVPGARAALRWLLAVLCLLAGSPGGSAGAAPLDWTVPSGHFYSQTGGDRLGFVVSDADGIPFQTELNRRGGPTALGYPISHRVEDMGNHYAVRLQRAVIQFWKVDVPWAKAGQTTVANGGDIAKEAGLFPAEPLRPAPAGRAPPGGAAPPGP